MTNPSEDLLATTEGVDEGSAKSTVEGPDSGGASSTEELTGVTNPIKRALGDADSTAAEADAQPAPPVDMESDESRAARAAEGTGQQMQAGEG
jgi:hypothetical protein